MKGNQPTLHEDILKLFREAHDDRRRSRDELARPSLEMAEQTDSGHGRIETRTAYLSHDLSWLTTLESWPGLAAVGLVVSETTDELTGKTSEEQRSFVLSDNEQTADGFLRGVREHWGVESRLHWVLDVDFGEDASRVRAGFAAENLAVIRRAAMNLLRRAQSGKGSLKLKRKRCGWNRESLLQVLGAARVAR